STRGFLFECYVIYLFCTGDQKFEVRKLKGEGKDQFSIDHKPIVGKVKNLPDLLKYSERNIVNVLNKQNFSAVDSFVTPNCILQVTVSEYHPIIQAELTKPVYINYTTRDRNSNKDRLVKRMDSTIINVEQWVLKVHINSMLEDKE
ncbi:9443_t:CDS:2, partial [Funneliformis geosporum]